MKYCTNCGEQILNEALACPFCGISQISDEGNFGYFLLGLFFPLPGIWLYLALKDIRPKSARKIQLAILVWVFTPIIILLITILFALIRMMLY